MPYCEVGETDSNVEIRIYYRTYGQGPTKVLLITGLAGTHDSWGPQIKGLTGTDRANDDETAAAVDGEDNDGVENEIGGGIEVCSLDNRGMGRSSVPAKKSDYSTRIMANDAIGLLDH